MSAQFFDGADTNPKSVGQKHRKLVLKEIKVCGFTVLIQSYKPEEDELFLLV